MSVHLRATLLMLVNINFPINYGVIFIFQIDNLNFSPMRIRKLIGTGCFLLLAGTLALAQSDPGISTHNYKHPNKAHKAQKLNKEGVKIRTFDYRAAMRLQTIRSKEKGNSMPRYARKYPLVVVRAEPVERKFEINPLNSPRNYKAQNTRNATMELASIE